MGLAGQLDAVIELAGPGVAGVAMGFVAMANLNAQASYVSLGVGLHLLR